MGFFTDTRKVLIAAFLSLPILLMTYFGFLTMGLASISSGFLFVGTAVLVPLLTTLLHLPGSLGIVGAGASVGIALGYWGYNGWDLFSDTQKWLPGFFLLVGTLVKYFGSALMPESEYKKSFGLVAASAPKDMNVNPSLWVSEIVFIFAYLFMGAWDLYKKPATPGAVYYKVDSRKQKANILMMILAMIFVLVVALRYSLGTETPLGITTAILTMGGLASIWYYTAKSMGGELADIFGVSTQMLSTSAQAERPKVCVQTS
jgi:hypothetical protein